MEPYLPVELSLIAAVPEPRRATPGSSGYDLCNAGPDVYLPAGARALVPTGVRIRITQPGWEAQVRPRSGLAHRAGVTVLNAPGTIDSDYTGEIQVLLINHGRADETVRRGDRIAQLVFARVGAAQFVEWTETPTQRGDGGFGSTGV